jgi:hypothetical protein
MDELTLIDHAVPHAAGPTPKARDAGREALLAELRRPVAAERSARWRGPRRLLATAAAVAAVTACVTLAQTLGGTPERGVLPGLSAANAAQLGELAAAAAEREPWVRPRPDQWVYQRTRNADGGFDMNRAWEGVDPRHTNDVSRWTRVDGEGFATIGENGRLSVHIERPGDGIAASGGPMFGVWNYHELPTEPAALLARLKTPYEGQTSPTTDVRVFGIITAMLDDPMPPRLRAALFRLLPTLEGVTMRRDVPDQIGRRGVAFENSDKWERAELIVDPGSFRYLGYRITALRDHADGQGNVTKAGTTITSSATVASRIVDQPGDRQ